MSGNDTQAEDPPAADTAAAAATVEEENKPETKKPKKRTAAAVQQVSSDVPIEKVYHRLVLGQEKLSWITQDGIHHGLKISPIYGTMRDPAGEDIPDKSIAVGQNKEFTIDYTEALAKKVMDVALETCVNPKFYLVDGGLKLGLKDPKNNFLGNIDDILKKFRATTIL